MKRMSLLLCFTITFAVPGVWAQQHLNIADITLHRDAHDVPVREGQRVTVSGVILRNPVALSDNAARAEVRDGGSAIFLFTRDAQLLMGKFKSGDIVSVTGKVSEYHGDDELLLDSITGLGATILPPPPAASINSLRSRIFQAQPFTVVGNLSETRVGKRSYVVVKDATSEIRLVTPTEWLLDPDLADAISSHTRATVTGVVSVSKHPDGTIDFALVPGNKSDVRVLPPSEIRRWATISLITGLLCILAAAMFSRQQNRRHAKRLEVALVSLEASEAQRVMINERFRSAQSSASMAAFTFDPDNSRLAWSADMSALSCFPDSSDLNAMAQYVNREHLQRLCSSASRLLIEGGAFEQEITLRGPNGEVALLIKAGRADDHQISGVAIDVTERRRLQEQLSESQKFEVVGRLAGGVAHDFNNLLTVILGYSEMLQEHVDGDATAQKQVLEIAKAARNATAVVSQLLAFSRKGDTVLALLDINNVCENAVKILAQTINGKHSVRFESCEGRKLMRADRAEIGQMLWNLALNAQDAMPEGGEIVLRTRDTNGFACIEVSDTGGGMDEDTRAHIFEPFFTTKDRVRGRGLGLATVYGIVQRMGGHIDVESELRVGTTVKVYLPSGGADQKQPSQEETCDIRPASVLFVEDEEPVRRLAASYLARKGFQVWSAADGKEALMLLDKHLDDISLIITDVIMPGMNGRELADAALKRKPSLRVMFMSGYTDQMLASSNISSSQLLKKPFTLSELVQEAYLALGRSGENPLVEMDPAMMGRG